MANGINRIIHEIWGTTMCGWDWIPLKGASGSQISIWNEDVVKVAEFLKSQRVLLVKLHCMIENCSGVGQCI